MWPGVTRALRPFSLYKPVLTDPLHIRKNTQKSKFLLSQAFKWKRIMFFVIPEMPSKTFVMVEKKLPDHLKIKVGSIPRASSKDAADFYIQKYTAK